VKLAWFIFLVPYIVMIIALIVITKMVIGIAKTQQGR
jgi:hypothetical protein